MGNSLKLSPEAIKQCVDATQELIDGLDDQIRRVDELMGLAGAGGTLGSAQQLMQGFVAKAKGRPDSVYERLMQFREVAIGMRDNFAAGGQGFAEMEAKVAEVLGGFKKDLQA